MTTPFSFAAQADARVQHANPSTNYGTATSLRNDAGPDVETFLRFQVSGLSGQVTSAKLRLYARTGTVNGPAVFSTGNGWTESGGAGITWNNRPGRASGAADDKGAIAASSFVEFDVKPLITGNHTYSFTLAATSTDGFDYSSRETGTITRRPQLLITP